MEDEEAKFFSYYCFDHAMEDGRSVAEAFLAAAAGRRLDPDERHAVERLIAARLRLYQVTEVALDKGLELHDLWSDERLFVRERSATHQLQRWDLLATRVTRFEGGANEMDGGAYLFPVRLKDDLLALLRTAHRAVRRKEPAAADDFFWRMAATLIHAFWLARVAFAEKPVMVTAEGDAMELGRIVFDVVDSDAVRTPRHAPRLKSVRPRLVDLLREMEKHEAHAARADNPPYDFGWVWRELGLESEA